MLFVNCHDLWEGGLFIYPLSYRMKQLFTSSFDHTNTQQCCVKINGFVFD